MTPYVFIVGCPRSGTTLLERILNQHPQLTIIHETHWIRTFFHSRTGMTQDGIVNETIIEPLLSHPQFGQLQMTREEIVGLLASEKPVLFSEFVTRLFDLYGQKQRKKYTGEKTPGYVRDLRIFHLLWPQAKFIHLIRDGRDVGLSAIDWTETDEHRRYPSWSENPVFTAAFWWEQYVRLGRDAATFIGRDHYQETRYEALVSNPKEECKSLCQFLSLPYDDSMLRLEADKGITPGLRNWKSQMSMDDIHRFESASGGLLDELGYERLFPKPDRLKTEKALDVRKAVMAYLRSNGLPLPAAWIGSNAADAKFGTQSVKEIRIDS
jgi:Sulfotransferase family